MFLLATDPQETPNRATVAGVDAKVDGLTNLVRAEFANTQRQLDLMAGVPTAVARLESNYDALEQRVADLETADTSRSVFRKGTLPMVLISFASLIVGVVLLIHYITT